MIINRSLRCRLFYFFFIFICFLLRATVANMKCAWQIPVNCLRIYMWALNRWVWLRTHHEQPMSDVSNMYFSLAISATQSTANWPHSTQIQYSSGCVCGMYTAELSLFTHVAIRHGEFWLPKKHFVIVNHRDHWHVLLRSITVNEYHNCGIHFNCSGIHMFPHN